MQAFDEKIVCLKDYLTIILQFCKGFYLFSGLSFQSSKVSFLKNVGLFGVEPGFFQIFQPLFSVFHGVGANNAPLFPPLFGAWKAGGHFTAKDNFVRSIVG